jgi:hypothetical protein
LIFFGFVVNGERKTLKKDKKLALQNIWARLEKGKQKLLEPLWGEREPFGKFSKDGSVIACMKRKQKPVANFGKENKSWRVTGSK